MYVCMYKVKYEAKNEIALNSYSHGDFSAKASKLVRYRYFSIKRS